MKSKKQVENLLKMYEYDLLCSKGFGYEVNEDRSKLIIHLLEWVLDKEKGA